MADQNKKDKCPHCGYEGKFESGTVFDPFCGRGTVGVVAKKLNRNFIGIDLNPKYIEMSKRCINNTMSSLF